MTYLLRVDAVNFGPTIFDTNDLSTIRGMGLAMLESPVRNVEGFTRIYAGGSVALWTFEATDDENAADKVRAYEQALKSAPVTALELEQNLEEAAATVHGQITFVTRYVPWRTTFDAAHRAAVAGCRWNQMKEPTLVYPEEALKDTPPAGRVCEVDAVRPATKKERRPEGTERWVSPFTLARRQLGLADRHVRERFYVGYVHAENAPESYINDLDQLTDYHGFGSQLYHKMAVIHLDGNGFGARTLRCASPDDLTAWSNRLKGTQSGFLRTLVGVQDAPDAWTTCTDDGVSFQRSPWRWAGWHTDNLGNRIQKHNAWRMEVLLWGGDEIAIVVPAWAGWWTLAKFFAATSREGGPDKLTYGAGLVFCHHNAPIRRVRRLADQLAGRAKAVSRDKNQCAYQVLESFDDMGLDPDKTADRLLASTGLTHSDTVLLGEAMEPMLREAPLLMEAIPKSKAYDVLRLLRSGQGEKAKQLITNTLKKANDEFGIEHGIALFGLDPLGSAPLDKQCRSGWLHLVELWDYLPVPRWTDPFAEGRTDV